jgi:protein gp37
VEDQKRADERIPLLLQTPAAVRFVSLEPLLDWIYLPEAGALKVERDETSNGNVRGALAPSGIDWVIVGGESGPHARPCNVEWIREVVRQCREAGVACFVKQIGALPTTEQATVHKGRGYVVGEAAYRLPGIYSAKGANPSEWPVDLRVREFPR